MSHPTGDSHNLPNGIPPQWGMGKGPLQAAMQQKPPLNGLESSHSPRGLSPVVSTNQIPSQQLPPARSAIPSSQLPPRLAQQSPSIQSARTTPSEIKHPSFTSTPNQSSADLGSELTSAFSPVTPNRTAPLSSNSTIPPTFNPNPVMSAANSILPHQYAPPRNVNNATNSVPPPRFSAAPSPQNRPFPSQFPMQNAPLPNIPPQGNPPPPNQNLPPPNQNLRPSVYNQPPPLQRPLPQQPPKLAEVPLPSQPYGKNNNVSNAPPVQTYPTQNSFNPRLGAPPPGPPAPQTYSPMPPQQQQVPPRNSVHSNRYPAGPPSGNVAPIQPVPTPNQYQNTYNQSYVQQNVSMNNYQNAANTRDSKGLSQQFANMSVVQSGYNKMWGADNFDLLQCPNILPAEKIRAPNISLGQEFLDAANCSSE